MKTAPKKEDSSVCDARYMTGKHTAQHDFKDVGAFQNPYQRHSPEWVGYHLIASKQYREDLNKSHYQQESY